MDIYSISFSMEFIALTLICIIVVEESREFIKAL